MWPFLEIFSSCPLLLPSDDIGEAHQQIVSMNENYYHGLTRPVITADQVEKLLQCVFHTITTIAVYEIIKEAFRVVTPSTYKALGSDAILKTKGFTCGVGYAAADSALPCKCCSLFQQGRSKSNDVNLLRIYLQELTLYARELSAEIEYNIRESFQRLEAKKKRNEDQLMLRLLKGTGKCICSVAASQLKTDPGPPTSNQNRSCFPGPGPSFSDRTSKNFTNPGPSGPCSTASKRPIRHLSSCSLAISLE